MARPQKGWFTDPVQTKKGPGHRARAYNPHKDTYKTKTFSGPASAKEAENWAKNLHAQFSLKQATTGRSPIAEILEAYFADQERRGLERTHRTEVRRVLLSAVAAGVQDLLHPSVKQHAREWLAGIQSVHEKRADRSLSPRTINANLAMLKAFANWCVAEDIISHSPFVAIKRAQEEDSLKSTFTVEECGKLTSGLTADGYGLVVALQLYGGLRSGEALNTRWDLIDFRAMTLQVRQWKDVPGSSHPLWRLKRRKERTIPLQPELAAILSPFAQLQGWVAPERFRFKGAQAQGRFLDCHCRERGVAKGDRTPHSTRHSWVAMMLASGENIAQVKMWAGHSDISTTEKYARSQADYRHDTRTWERGVFQFHPKPVEKQLETLSHQCNQ